MQAQYTLKRKKSRKDSHKHGKTSMLRYPLSENAYAKKNTSPSSFTHVIHKCKYMLGSKSIVYVYFTYEGFEAPK